MASYLVTGGCGFIGSHLADALLTEGHAVRVLDDLSTGLMSNLPGGAQMVKADVADPAAVAAAAEGVDGIFHLAAIASVERGNQDWLGTHRTNLTGSITVFDAARRARSGGAVPIVYASSAAVYGANQHLPLVESSATRPLSAYGADKLGSEQHAAVGGYVHGVPSCGLRFFNVYGPRQDPRSPYSGVISIFCDRLKAARPITIYGDGEQFRDFVFVADVVRALLAAMRCADISAPVLNVCTGRSTTVRALAATISEILHISPEIEFAPPRQGEIRGSLGDAAQAARTLGFEATMELQAGLERTLASL